MNKFILAIFLLTFTLSASAQQSNTKANAYESRYLAGAVPTVNGYVQFSKTYEVKGKSKSSIFNALKHYTEENVVNGPDHLPQARMTEADSINGTIAASLDEYLYFKRTKWQIHRVHFYYQLVFEVKDDGYTVTMRNLHYKYDPEANTTQVGGDYRAENWITDEAALTANGKKLARISGKFRKATIDRKDAIFLDAARAAGVKFKKKVVEVEETE